MWLRVPVDDAKCIFGTRSEQKVVASASVLDNSKHDIAAIGVQRVAGRHVNGVRIVKSASIGDDFVCVVLIERHEVGDLSAFGIDDCQVLALLDEE